MEYLPTVALAVISGLIARLYMLHRDYRQYPSYPQGWAIHIFLGFIGATIGAIIVPAFIEKEFGAISFLLLAASQFREVRNVERTTLANMEATELVSRGTAYIEGIARVFEARNYLAIWTALTVAIVAEMLSFNIYWQVTGSIATAIVAAVLLSSVMRGKNIGDIAEVEVRPISFDGSLLVIAGVHMMNVGLDATKQKYRERGLGALIRPKGPNAKATLSNIGQMQAIAHDVSSMMGVYMDVGEQEFTPIVRRDPDSGSLMIVIVPAHHNEKALEEAIRRVPVLEGAIRKPLRSVAGQMLE